MTEADKCDAQPEDDVCESGEVLEGSDVRLGLELERKTWKGDKVLDEFIFSKDAKVNEDIWQINNFFEKCAASADEELKELQRLPVAFEIGLAR